MELEKEHLGFWEKLLKLKSKYGYWELTKLVVFVAFAITLLFMAKNFGENYSFERQKEAMTEVMEENTHNIYMEHNEKLELRKEIKPYILEVLKSTISQMDADRAFVIELHNGSNNTAGLPFIHCTMTYEEVSKNVEPVDEDYQNLSLTRFSFPEYLHKHDLWYGSIEDFYNIDRKVAARMKHNGATYMVIATIHSEENEIGYFGFTYCDNREPKDTEEIIEFLINAVQKLSKLLDNHINNT